MERAEKDAGLGSLKITMPGVVGRRDTRGPRDPPAKALLVAR